MYTKLADLIERGSGRKTWLLKFEVGKIINQNHNTHRNMWVRDFQSDSGIQVFPSEFPQHISWGPHTPSSPIRRCQVLEYS